MTDGSSALVEGLEGKSSGVKMGTKRFCEMGASALVYVYFPVKVMDQSPQFCTVKNPNILSDKKVSTIVLGPRVSLLPFRSSHK